MINNTWASVVCESLTKIEFHPGGGFPTHSHRDMEIITYVLEGAVAHKDSTGTSTVIRPGDVQRMSAGTGISHSEYNASQNEPVHFLQIWIVPDETGLVPGYEQKAFSLDKHQGAGTLVASKDGRDGSITVHQNVDVWAARLSPEEQASFSLETESSRLDTAGARCRNAQRHALARGGRCCCQSKKRSWRSRLSMRLSF